MTQPRPPRAESADAVVARITSGMNIFVHGAAATPTALLEALARRTDLENVGLDAPSCSSLHRTATGYARLARRSMRPGRRSIPRRSCSPRSTHRCPAPTAARSPNAASCSCRSRTRTSGVD